MEARESLKESQESIENFSNEIAPFANPREGKPHHSVPGNGRLSILLVTEYSQFKAQERLQSICAGGISRRSEHKVNIMDKNSVLTAVM